jgi:two-component system, chemotaxis family, sensor kinase Cph1
MFTQSASWPEKIDLTNCDREPIHIPGLIQPHGLLLVLQAPEFKIIQVSRNVFDWLGVLPQDLLGQPLANLLPPEQIASIHRCLEEDFEYVNPLALTLQSHQQQLEFDGIVHPLGGAPEDSSQPASPASDEFAKGFVILELEPRSERQNSDFLQFYQHVKGIITKIQKAPTLQAMSQVAAEEIRKITGFDRVMIYRLNDRGAGEVIAEDCLESLEPYLGLHYPDSDIPQQAKHLYTLNWLRLIPDVAYEPVELVPQLNPIENSPTDLSLSLLRSVSPLHVEYLKNMGVKASMSISLIQDKKLWGLIACHHSTPRHVPYAVRTICEFIGQVVSVELIVKESHEDLDYKVALKSLQGRFVEGLSQSQSFLEGLVNLDQYLLKLVGATGVAVCTGEQIVCIGKTPSMSELPALREWVKSNIQNNLLQTQSLPRLYPAAEAFKAVASGLLALEISKVNQNYLLWFRPEVSQTVYWGGNPNKPIEILEEGEVRLSPRKSFERWQETVEGCSVAWKACEIETATELRSLIVGIILTQADEMAKINLELERSNTELDAFAYVASHDLKEPLRGIHNYANFLMEDYETLLPEDGIAKLQTLVRLTQRMENLINSLLHYSRLGRTEISRKPTNLNDLVRQVVDTFTISQPDASLEFCLPRSLPTVNCDRTQVSELFTNLISNAIKYNDSVNKQIEIGFIEADIDTFYVRDNGIGIPPQHLERIFQIFKRLHAQDEYGGGTGAGLTIVQKIVERHGGTIWVESTLNQGSTFYFTLSAEATL